MFLVGVMAGAVGLFDRSEAQQIGSDTPVARSLDQELQQTNVILPYNGSVSQTGESLAEQLQQSGSNQPYNLKLGPIELRAEADLTGTFNDNIGLTKTDRISDFIITPMGIIHGRWEVSDLNTLTLNVGIGYEAYMFNSQYNSLLIAPDSEASFNFFVGEVAINLHDAFSYEQDPTTVGQLSNQVRLSRFQNDVGVSAKWDLNDVMVEADYDHTNLWVTQTYYDYLTNQSDTIAPKVTIKLDESISTGVSASFSDTRYERSFENDNTSESAGPFVNATFSKYLSLTAQLGGFLTQYDHGGGNGDSSDVSSYYAYLGVNHQINDVLTESLTGGKEYLPGLTSNYTERIYANYGDHWQATKSISVASSLFWENLSDSNATFRENSDRYGVNLGFTDSLSDHANLTFNYQFLLKDADPSYLSYYQSQGTVGMQYNF
jgi:hypothetical protein